jgi:hypothetical protein
LQKQINRRVMRMLAVASMLGSRLMAQDIIQGFLGKVDAQAVTWANILVVLGIVLLGGKYIFIDHRDSEKLWGTVWGCLFLLGARAIATFFLPAPVG